MSEIREVAVRWRVEPVLHCPDPAAWAAVIAQRSATGEGGCVLWTGTIDQRDRKGTGYGKFRFSENGRKRMTGAHRAAYLALVGDIPRGMVVDHLCFNPLCVNVDHLELVTPHENTLRAVAVGRTGGNRKRTSSLACGQHGREDGYVFTSKEGRKRWTCRICRDIRMARWREARGLPPSNFGTRPRRRE